MSETESDRRLRALLRDEAGDPSDTPDPEFDAQVEALLSGDLDEAEAQDLAGQLLDDPELAFQVRVAVEMQHAREEEEAAAAPAVTRSNAGSRWAWATAFAAAAALLVFVVARPPPLPPGGESPVRSGTFPLLAPTQPSATLPRDAFVLEWTGGPTGAVYELFVTTPSLQPVYQARELPAPRHTVPASALKPYPTGSRFVWRVVAVTDEGRRIHSTAFEAIVR